MTKVNNGIPWDNYVMRKFGQSIRKNIAESYVKPAVKAHKVYAMSQALKIAKQIKDAWVSNEVGHC